ncbi:MAG: prolyl oligopeptidase family serine peptidase, partial [Pseudomonadota bacterium]
GLPDNPRLGSPTWSPTGDSIALTNTTPDGIELWVVDVAKARARKLTDRPLNLAASLRPTWLSDGKALLVPLRLEDEGEAPERPRAPAGPTVQQNLGETRPARTYQDLLTDAHDEALFRHYFTAQLAIVDLDGDLRPVGDPAILRGFDASPDGELIMVTELVEPFSYNVPASRFPRVVSLYDRKGRLEQELVRKPLLDQIPLAFGSVETGPRDHSWRADAPATLVWAEAQDGGDAGTEAEIRDHVYQHAWPMKGEPELLAALGQRSGGVMWGDDETALVVSWWWPTRNVRVWRAQPGDPDSEPSLLREYSWQDRYNDPGNPVMETNAAGRSVLKFSADGDHIFMIGDGASDEGDRPFLDRVTLATGESTRLFRSEAPYYERPQDVLDDTGERILTRREAPEEPPNFFIRELGGDSLAQITEFPHPTPELRGASKELVRYQRSDGVDLTGTLYLPPGYSPEDGPLPTLLWAYPTEFKSADAAGQVQDSPYRFVRVNFWSPLVWLLQGYAVLDDPSMPIIGEGEEEPNDTYVEQLVASAEAAVDMLVERGVGDREKMAIGGHSYGAFMTANLLAHSDLFAAGIARSGAYNRTLTPFGFQAEERTFWESPEVYFSMSPFMHADKIDEPMLMIHGEMDNNSGTFPMQSERMYDAMKALGGTVRLVMLPYESHGYRARESILHMMWEQQQWLDRWVLGESANPPAATPQSP